MPVANCFERFRIGIQRLQLDQRHGLLVLAMADKHEHFTPFAFFLRGHAEYRDLIAYLHALAATHRALKGKSRLSWR